MDIWMDVDTALAEVPINVMPLIDDTDFKAIEASVVYNAAGLALKWNFVTTGGAYTQTAVTPTTAGVYDWVNQGNGMYSIEIPASGGASINNDTEGFGWFSGVATGVLPWRGPVIGFRAAALNNSFVDGATVDVNVTAMAANTLTASALATDAVTEIQSGLATPTNITAGTVTTVTNLTNLPTIPANWLTAAGLATDAVTEIQAGLALEATLTAIKGAGWSTETLAAIDVLIDAIKAKTDNLPASPASQTNLDVAVSTRLATAGYTAPPSSADVTAIKAKTDNLPANPASQTNLDVAVSTRLATAGYTAPPSVGDIATAVWSSATRSLTTFGTLIADIWANVTRTLTSAGAGGATAQEVWEYATRTLSAFGFTVATNSDANVTAIKVTVDTNLDMAISDIVLNPTINATVAVSAAEAARLVTDKFTLTTSYSFSQAITSTLTDNLSTATKLWCVIKNRGDDDANGLVLIEKTAGLTILNRTSYITTTNGSLTVTGSAGDWVINTVIDKAATALLEAHDGLDFVIGWKALIAGNAIPVGNGEIRILRGAVDAIA